MKTKITSFDVITVLFLVVVTLQGCAVGPGYYGGGQERVWYDVSEPTGPTGFMQYSEDRGTETMVYNPCQKTGGIKSDTKKFNATTNTSGTTSDGIEVRQTTYNSKTGECN